MLEQSFIIAFIVFGLHYIMYTHGMIFSFVADWAARVKLPQYIDKPLYSCPICMVPWWGTAIYWAVWGNSVGEWIFVVICGMGINAVIVFLRK